MTDNSGESFSSTSGLLSGAAPAEAPAQAPALSRLNPSRPRGFRALVRQAAAAGDAVPRTTSQVDSPRISALAGSNPSMSQASNSPLLGRLGDLSSSFTEDTIEPQEQSAAKSRFGMLTLCLSCSCWASSRAHATSLNHTDDSKLLCLKHLEIMLLCCALC